MRGEETDDVAWKDSIWAAQASFAAQAQTAGRDVMNRNNSRRRRFSMSEYGLDLFWSRLLVGRIPQSSPRSAIR